MPYFGKYRGKVIDPNDPLRLGRIIALVPAISETPLSWALPAAPYAGRGVGFFALPPVGAHVWIEFEGGDANYPIWSGCFWFEDEAPAGPNAVVLQTNLGALRIDDGEATLRLSLAVPDGVVSLAMTAAGLELSFNEVGIRIGKEAVTVNGVALGG
jgi:hypothetical protein